MAIGVTLVPLASDRVELGDEMQAFLLRFATDESGETAIEYGLIAGSMSLVIVTACLAMGKTLVDFFTSIVSAFPS